VIEWDPDKAIETRHGYKLDLSLVSMTLSAIHLSMRCNCNKGRSLADTFAESKVAMSDGESNVGFIKDPGREC
jgi:hypothetical protein